MHTSEFIFIVAFVIYFFIRGVFEARSKNAPGVVGRRVDVGEKILLVIMALGCLIVPVLYLSTRLFGFADYRLPSFVPFVGTAVMVLALWIFWRSHVDLGEYWSKTLEIREGHKLVTHGIYRSVRHPMYVAIWLFGLAQGLLLQNWLAGWSAFIAFAMMYFFRVAREERMMEESFGQDYRDYVSRTGRLLPRIKR